jgi:hypothetical protein
MSPLSLISRLPFLQRPGAVKGAQRRSEPLRARTDAESSETGKGGGVAGDAPTPYRAPSSAAIKGEAVNGAERFYSRLRLHKPALSDSGWF